MVDPAVAEQNRREPFYIFLITVAVTLAYAGILSNGFIGFDDKLYITGNSYVQKGITFDNILWAFNFQDKGGLYWHPLTWLSLMLDHQLFGSSPRAFHIVNLLFHAGSALLIFHLFRAITDNVPASLATALLFAVHPLNVESVAWAAERKSVLSLFLMLLAIHLYVRYVKSSSRTGYVLMLAVYLAALLAKPAVITLPALLLALDFWPLGRFASASPKRLLLEKIPLLLLALVVTAVSVASVKMNPFDSRPYVAEDPFMLRIQGAVHAYGAYLKKIFVPLNLSLYYPARSSYQVWEVILPLLVVAGLLVLAWRLRSSSPWILSGMLWYCAALVPMSGLIRDGLWPETADRFVYIPFIGLFAALSFSWNSAAKKFFPDRQTVVFAAICAVFILWAGGLTALRVQVWKDGETIWSNAVRTAPKDRFALQGYAEALEAAGKQEQAVEYFEKAVAAEPKAHEIHNQIGFVKIRLGRIPEAVQSFTVASRLNPRNDAYRTNLGAALMQSGRFADASSELLPVLGRAPSNVRVACMLAAMARKSGNDSQALVYYSQARQYNPDEAENACASISAMLDAIEGRKDNNLSR